MRTEECKVCCSEPDTDVVLGGLVVVMIGGLDVDVVMIGGLDVDVVMIGGLDVDVVMIGGLDVDVVMIGGLDVDFVMIGGLDVDVVVIGGLDVFWNSMVSFCVQFVRFCTAGGSTRESAVHPSGGG